MQAIVKKLADEKGLDLVVDTQVALYIKPALDLTGEATAAYDKAYPVAPAAPAAPPKK
jgi:outer membrane protein